VTATLPPIGTGRVCAVWPWRLLAFVLFAAVAVRLAWLGDDAYITLRTVENWATGAGLRWNPDDRVQTFTHPLWMFCLAAARLVAGEVYFATIGLSLGVSFVAVSWLLQRASSGPAVLVGAVVLIAARAFPEYATSGLETPLTFLLLVAFVSVATNVEHEPRRRLRSLGVLAALLACNRLDLALLAAPPVLAAMRGVPIRSALATLGFAGLPLVLWLAFATVWFGSPLPVTAHAKAFGLGIPAGELAEQGLRYLLHAGRTDLVLLLVATIGAGVAAAARPTRWLGVGALLYVAYVVKVGGDFMQGRFLLPPFVVVVAALLPRLASLTRAQAWLCALFVVIACVPGGVPSWLEAPGDEGPLTREQVDAQHGIADERRMYVRELGLWSPSRTIPTFGSLAAMVAPDVAPDGGRERWWLLNGAVGSAGYAAGSVGHVVDPLLCDPLIARLPARNPSKWRIGHVLRRIPEGYWETLVTGENRLLHDGLRRYHDDVRLASQGPLFSSERAAAVVRLLVGARNDDLRRFVDEHYRTPPRQRVAAAELSRPGELGAYWFERRGLRVCYEGGLEVTFAEPQRARWFEAEVVGLCAFRVRFVLDGNVVGEAMGAPVAAAAAGGLRAVAGVRRERFAVPADVPAFDALHVDFVEIPQSHQAPGPAGLAAVVLGP
jgi:arabinofuranosyltransferase